MADPTQIDRHDILKVHGAMGTGIGTIIPGTIVLIRVLMCYSCVADEKMLCPWSLDIEERGR
jgi:hypothetical protein